MEVSRELTSFVFVVLKSEQTETILSRQQRRQLKKIEIAKENGGKVMEGLVDEASEVPDEPDEDGPLSTGNFKRNTQGSQGSLEQSLSGDFLDESSLLADEDEFEEAEGFVATDDDSEFF